ncbi:hypothetical protein [Pantoea sp. 18069]|uniref:hypothetical protein n=1 Tax=Pantoea sp. 18069 TaxID=2681415 RepID=UPI00135A7078|nr:hypothetical protein [Pantoea sp. 18069]
MRAAPLLLLLSLAASPLLAQNPPGDAVQAAPAAPEPRATQGDRNNQRVERIRVEDEGSRVDEVRIGGQTQSITVTPKVGDMPAYEVQPSEGVRNRSRSSSDTTGPRVWNMLKF